MKVKTTEIRNLIMLFVTGVEGIIWRHCTLPRHVKCNGCGGMGHLQKCMQEIKSDTIIRRSQ